MKRLSLAAIAGALLLGACVSLFHVHRTGRMPHWCHVCCAPTVVIDNGPHGHCVVCGGVWDTRMITQPFVLDWSQMSLPLVHETSGEPIGE
jgi:hypothetical protein